MDGTRIIVWNNYGIDIMTADIHNFLSTVPARSEFYGLQNAVSLQQGYNAVMAAQSKPARKPLNWLQMKWVEETYGPRRDHPPCLTVQNTPSINSLNGLGEPSIGPVGLSHE